MMIFDHVLYIFYSCRKTSRLPTTAFPFFGCSIEIDLVPFDLMGNVVHVSQIIILSTNSNSKYKVAIMRIFHFV